MCHAACQPPHCIHLLRLAELYFKLLPLYFRLLPLYFMLLSLFFVPLQCVAHVLESAGDLCHFVTTMRFQWIDEITLFERAHSLREVRQWTRGPVRNHTDQYAAPYHGG